MAIPSHHKECRICANETGNQLHQAREMFSGSRDLFNYIECSECGTLQIQSVPDLRPYYSSTYYSLQPVIEKERKGGIVNDALRSIGIAIRKMAGDYYVGKRSVVNNFVVQQISRHAPQLLVGFPKYLKDTSLDLSLNRTSKVLDVGSGAGHTLVDLSHFGFRNLLGVDPFVESEVDIGANGRVLNADLSKVTGQFDLILSNHAIEHVRDPRQTLDEIYRLLKPGRYAIIRMPVISYAWRKYHTNWVQLDAPRHLFLFTAEYFSKLAVQTGFEVKKIRYDSTAFQFWGSEQYLNDVPLLDEKSYFVNPESSAFTTEQISAFAAEAEQLNARAEGDQAVFYLFKV